MLRFRHTLGAFFLHLRLACRCGLRAWRLDVGESVADAPHVDDRTGALLGELAAQPACMRVQGSCAGGALEPPDVTEQFALREHAPGLAREGGQERELLCAQVDYDAVDADLACDGVDLDRAYSMHAAAEAVCA